MVVWIIGTAIILFLLVSGYLFSEKSMHIRAWTFEKLLAKERNEKRFSEEWYAGLTREPLAIPSPHGYTLAGEYWPVAHPKGIVILSHGVTMNRYASLKYAEMFHALGFSCFAFEHCRHGESGGKYTTYGYYEKYDLKAIVDWVRERFGNVLLGVHGESMGSGVLLQYAGFVEDGADFYVADCAYASIWDQFSYRLRVEYHLPVFPMMYMSALFCRIRCGFRMKETCPLKAVPHIQHPILFIHGADDRYIPPEASQSMYDAKINGIRAIAFIEGARHATAQPTAPMQYKRIVADFMNTVILDTYPESEEKVK